MAKPKRKTLPKDFEYLLAKGEIEPLKAVFQICELDARGGAFKQTALAFNNCPDELANWLLDNGADLHATDSYGDTPLHSRAGHWQGKIELLLNRGADVLRGSGTTGTPLHRAARVGNLATARSLLTKGAQANATNESGQTPLEFALEQCSNASIEQMAPMAELLLGAMAPTVEKKTSFIGRFFRGATPQTSVVTPAMQKHVQHLGTNFEFHRAGYNPERLDQASDALYKLYQLFGVTPVPRRVIYDGKSPIIAKANNWQAQHQELWELLVPSGGAASTVQGEVIRISGRIGNEIIRNGGINWDKNYRQMSDAFLVHIASANSLPAPVISQAKQLLSEVKSLDQELQALCQMAVDWVAINPNPIKLPSPNYNR